MAIAVWIGGLGWAQAPGSGGAGPAPGASTVRDWNFTLKKDGRTQALFRGGTATPVAAAGQTIFEVDGFHVDTFGAEGEPEMTAESPRCRVQIENGSFVVTSPAALRVVRADGRLELTGEGFHWDHGVQRLVVSNRVKTVLLVPIPKLGG